MISIREFVGHWIDPLYQAVGEYAPLLILIVVLILLVYVFRKIQMKHKAKISRKYKVGSTNDWFSWEMYEEWKKTL